MTRIKLTAQANITPKQTTQIPTAKLDPKGRKIAYQIETYEIDFIDQPDEIRQGHMIEPGHYYAARVQITKNGRAFGATQLTKYLKDSEARDRYIARRTK